MDANEYLEKILADSYRREVTQEERLARSLPSFATTLAVLAIIVGVLRPAIPMLSWSLFSVGIHSILLFLGVCAFLAILFLLRALWPRSFAYLMRENELNAYIRNLRRYYRHTDLATAEIEEAIAADVRDAMIEQYAEGAIRNRANNAERASARGYALSALLAALAFAFLMIAALLVHDGMRGIRDVGSAERGYRSTPSQELRARQEDGADLLQAGAAADAKGAQGRLDA
jgi:hypothetical protein